MLLETSLMWGRGRHGDRGEPQRSDALTRGSERLYGFMAPISHASSPPKEAIYYSHCLRMAQRCRVVNTSSQENRRLRFSEEVYGSRINTWELI